MTIKGYWFLLLPIIISILYVFNDYINYNMVFTVILGCIFVIMLIIWIFINIMYLTDFEFRKILKEDHKYLLYITLSFWIHKVYLLIESVFIFFNKHFTIKL